MTTVLVIEDDASILEDLLFLLEQSGYETVGASDGESGIESAHLHLPDIIVCDIMMPDISGHEVLKALQQSSRVSRIPFIFMTALAEQDDVRTGMALGADDYVTKPFKHEDLLKSIQARLKRHAELELHRLRRYTQQFIRRQEVERERLARLLFQDVQNVLAGLRLTLAADQYPPEMLIETQRKAHQTVDEIIQSIVGIAQDLHPTIVDHLGLLPALLWLFERYREMSLSIQFKHMGLDKPLDPTVSRNVFRIIQEALQNVQQHAGTTSVTLQLARQTGVLHLQIEDHGKGFDLDQVFQDEEYSGLVGIYERVMALSGSINITTAPNEGTRLICTIPIAGYEEPYAEDKHDRVMQLSQAFPEQEQVPFATHDDFIRVVIIAGAVVRAGISLLLSQDERFAVVIEMDAPENMSARLVTTNSDVILINPYGLERLPYEVIDELTRTVGEIPILVYSPWIEKNYVVDVLAAGASGVVAQQAPIEELATALQRVHSGERYLPPGISREEINELVVAYQEDEFEIDLYQTLTAREKEIFQHIAEGMTNAAIAHQLTISVRTVETHRANLMRKLGLVGSHELIRYALRLGVIS
jgi:DNA-binding NarL/FixJ family response regulator